jgi:hypothetical protein
MVQSSWRCGGCADKVVNGIILDDAIGLSLQKATAADEFGGISEPKLLETIWWHDV